MLKGLLDAKDFTGLHVCICAYVLKYETFKEVCNYDGLRPPSQVMKLYSYRVAGRKNDAKDDVLSNILATESHNGDVAMSATARISKWLNASTT